MMNFTTSGVHFRHSYSNFDQAERLAAHKITGSEGVAAKPLSHEPTKAKYSSLYECFRAAKSRPGDGFDKVFSLAPAFIRKCLTNEGVSVARRETFQ